MAAANLLVQRPIQLWSSNHKPEHQGYYGIIIDAAADHSCQYNNMETVWSWTFIFLLNRKYYPWHWFLAFPDIRIGQQVVFLEKINVTFSAISSFSLLWIKSTPNKVWIGRSYTVIYMIYVNALVCVYILYIHMLTPRSIFCYAAIFVCKSEISGDLPLWSCVDWVE